MCPGLMRMRHAQHMKEVKMKELSMDDAVLVTGGRKVAEKCQPNEAWTIVVTGNSDQADPGKCDPV